MSTSSLNKHMWKTPLSLQGKQHLSISPFHTWSYIHFECLVIPLHLKYNRPAWFAKAFKSDKLSARQTCVADFTSHWIATRGLQLDVVSYTLLLIAQTAWGEPACHTSEKHQLLPLSVCKERCHLWPTLAPSYSTTFSQKCCWLGAVVFT